MPRSERPHGLSLPLTMLLLALALRVQPLWADPWIPAGDVAMRSDLQLLADYGVIREPSQTWPRSWPEVARAVLDAPVDGLPDYVVVALARVRAAAEAAGKTTPLAARVSIAGAVHPTRLRTFEDSPRENALRRLRRAFPARRFRSVGMTLVSTARRFHFKTADSFSRCGTRRVNIPSRAESNTGNAVKVRCPVFRRGSSRPARRKPARNSRSPRVERGRTTTRSKSCCATTRHRITTRSHVVSMGKTFRSPSSAASWRSAEPKTVGPCCRGE